MNLPYPQAFRFFEAAHKRLRATSTSEAHVLSRTLLPGLDRVTWAQARVERNLAALRVIEAVRIYAAAHGASCPTSSAT